MYKGKLVTALLAAFLIVAAIPAAATAAPIEITASIKPSLDKAIVDADQAQASKINSKFSELVTLLKQRQDLDGKVNTLQTGNKDTLAELNKLIKQIDATELDQLEADAVQARERNKPLFSQYSSLNKQIEAVRSLKNKDLNLMLRFQANVLKIPVQLARLEIKAKESSWRAAKDRTAKTVKEIRATLADMEPIKVQIKARQSEMKAIDTRAAAVWSEYKLAVKKKDSPAILNTLTSVVSLSGQINEEQQKIVQFETAIHGILTAAKAQIP